MNPKRKPTWKQRARALKQEIHALYLACKDPRVPWYTRLLAAVVVGYALSPIDLIPDPIPVLGYLDDLILIPAGIYLVIKMIPIEVLRDCRQQAAALSHQSKPKNWVAGTVIIVIWLIVFAILAYFIYSYAQGWQHRV